MKNSDSKYHPMPIFLRLFNFEDIRRAGDLFSYNFETNEISLKSTGESVSNLTGLAILQIKFANMWNSLNCFPNRQQKTIWGEDARDSYYYLIWCMLDELYDNKTVTLPFYERLVKKILEQEKYKRFYDIYMEMFFCESNRCILNEFFKKLEGYFLSGPTDLKRTIDIKRCIFANARAYSGAYETGEGIYRNTGIQPEEK